MMPGEPKLVRVDERLVHGQVAVAWLKHLSCSSVCIIDSEVSGDQYIQEIFRMALGPGNRLVAYAPEDAPLYWGEWEDCLVLVRSAVLACDIFENGATFSQLNLGGMGKRIGRRRLLDNIYASEEEIRSLRFLRDGGVRLFYQSVPGEDPVDLAPYLNGESDDSGDGKTGNGVVSGGTRPAKEGSRCVSARTGPGQHQK